MKIINTTPKPTFSIEVTENELNTLLLCVENRRQFERENKNTSANPFLTTFIMYASNILK